MVRIWSLPPSIFDQQRLNGEHVELHILVSVHLRMLEIAQDQQVPIHEIDWTGIRLGWRTHPQLLWGVGRVGAVIERHDLVAEELVRRGFQHNSPMDEALDRLRELDPLDNSYGSLSRIVASDPDRSIWDLRHLLEKWDRDEESGKTLRGHDRDEAVRLLVELVGSKSEADKLREEKLLI